MWVECRYIPKRACAGVGIRYLVETHGQGRTHAGDSCQEFCNDERGKLQIHGYCYRNFVVSGAQYIEVSVLHTLCTLHAAHDTNYVTFQGKRGCLPDKQAPMSWCAGFCAKASIFNLTEVKLSSRELNENADSNSFP